MKSAGGGTAHVQADFSNFGTVEVQAGTFSFGQNFGNSVRGTLSVRIADTTEFDHYSIAGVATLGGTLHVDLAPGFEPELGDIFEIMTYGLRIGTFALVDDPLIGSAKRFAIPYGATTVTLGVVPGP